MPDNEDTLPGQLTGYLTAAQIALSVAGAAGLTALATRWWYSATRGDDEKFLAALASHEAAIARVEKIREAALDKEKIATKDADHTAVVNMRDLALQLEERADANLHAAIARATWKSSQQRHVGQGFIVVSFLVFLFGGFAIFGQGEPDKVPYALRTVIRFSFFLSLGSGVLILGTGKSFWIDAEVKGVHRVFDRGRGRVKAEQRDGRDDL